MTDTDPTQENPKDPTENPGEFWNVRGETFDASLRLFVDSVQGETWVDYAQTTMPREVLAEFGMIDKEGSEEWINVLEHSMAVTISCIDLAERLQAQGVLVDVDAVERAAWVHDAHKRFDIEKKLTREAEAQDTALGSILEKNDYTNVEIAAAKNSGRLYDRYLEGDERNRVIESRSIEENIVGYIDARHRGTKLMTLKDARDESIRAKPKDEAFFRDNWYPYYTAVEGYFAVLAPNFKPDDLTEESRYRTVQNRLDERT